MEYLKPWEIPDVENIERGDEKKSRTALLGTPTTHSSFIGQLGDEELTKKSEGAAEEVEEPGGCVQALLLIEGGHDQPGQMLLFQSMKELLLGVMDGSQDWSR